jgi:ATPase subunit of ABC transporter with duplicated ATPase domains
VAHEFVFTIHDLRKVVPPDRVILDAITLAFLPGAKIGVLGANGAGKSSLLRIMAGVDEDFLGEARPMPGVRIGYLPQEPTLDANLSVLGNVEQGVRETRALLQRFEEVSAKFAEPLGEEEMNALLEEQGALQDRIDACGGWELERTLEIAMDALRCPPGDADVATLSGGERRRVALCRLLLEKPDLLLLDEPTNHLDAESVAWLERFLQEYPGTVVAVTHDRYFLDNVAGWILELDRGRGIPWRGNYSSWLDQKRQRLAVEEKQVTARSRTLERELEWIRMAPRARQAKSKARIRAYEELRASEERQRSESVEIAIPPAPRLGDVVIDAEHLCKGYEGRLLIDDLSFVSPLDRGGEARRGIVPAGRNRAARLRRPEPRRARARPDRVGGDQRRRGLDPRRKARAQLARLRGLVQLSRPGSAEAGR